MSIANPELSEKILKFPHDKPLPIRNPNREEII